MIENKIISPLRVETLHQPLARNVDFAPKGHRLAQGLQRTDAAAKTALRHSFIHPQCLQAGSSRPSNLNLVRPHLGYTRPHDTHKFRRVLDFKRPNAPRASFES